MGNVIKFSNQELMEIDLKRSMKEKAKYLKNKIPAIFLALKRKDTPFVAKLFAFITITYALSPIDLIPDFIPVLGYLDDLIILPLLISFTIRFIPKNIIEECEKTIEKLDSLTLNKKWYYGLPIIVIWIMIILIIVKKIFLK